MHDRRHAPRCLPGDDPAAIAVAAEAILAGRLVAFPTETVYGLGANALDAEAVARVFAAKRRPAFDPIIVHLADPADVARWADPADAADPRVARLAARFWPGPLTLVLRKRPEIPGIVTAGLDTVGLRVPDHPIAQALIRAAGVPVAAPSANPFGQLSPTRAEHVVRALDGQVDLVLDGGPCRVGVESTVLLLAGGRTVLLRPGGITSEQLEAELGRPIDLPSQEDRAAAVLAADGVRAELSPGRADVHYAPGIPLALANARDRAIIARLAPARGERVGLLAASAAGAAWFESAGAAEDGEPFAVVEVLAPDGDPVAAAARLFEALHALELAGVSRIVAEAIPERGLGQAIMDRLRRASTPVTPGRGASGEPLGAAQ